MNSLTDAVIFVFNALTAIVTCASKGLDVAFAESSVVC